MHVFVLFEKRRGRSEERGELNKPEVISEKKKNINNSAMLGVDVYAVEQ